MFLLYYIDTTRTATILTIATKPRNPIFDPTDSESITTMSRNNDNDVKLEQGFTLSEASVVPPTRVIQESDVNVTYTSSPRPSVKSSYGSAHNSPSSSISCLKKTLDPALFAAMNGSSSNVSRLSFPTPQFLCSCGCLRQFGEGCAFATSRTGDSKR